MKEILKIVERTFEEHSECDLDILTDFNNGTNLILSGLNKYKIYIADLIYQNNISDDSVSNQTYDEQLTQIKTSIKNYCEILKTLKEYIGDNKEDLANDNKPNTETTIDSTFNYNKNPQNNVSIGIINNIEKCILDEGNLYKYEITYYSNNNRKTVFGYRCNQCGKFFITIEQYQNINKTHGITNTNITPYFYKGAAPKAIKFNDFVVISNIAHCTHENHNVQDIIANIGVIKNSGKLLIERVNASYCYECNRFVILKQDFDRIDGVINCKIINKPNSISNSDFSDFEISDKDTLFNQRGYNVNCIDNLPEPQRQCILRQILENNELSKLEICSYVDTLISRGEKRPNWCNAVKKWKQDRNYIENYVLPNLPEVDVDTITVNH